MVRLRNPDGPPDQQSDNGQVSYPIDLIRQVAGKILENVTKAEQNHVSTWWGVQGYVDSSDNKVHDPMYAVLNTHEQRLRASYQWQADFASALYKLADKVEEMDRDVAQGFTAPKN